MELDRIYNMDCLEGMKSMPDDSVDYSITSPPYNFCLRLHGGRYTHRSSGEQRAGLKVNKYTNGLSDSLPMEDYYQWQCDCIDQMLRLTKDIVFYNIQIVTGNKSAVLRILGKYADNIKEVLIWDKCNGEPAIQGGVLNSEYELILALSKNDCKGRQFYNAQFERGTMSNVIRINKNHENQHRAAFPMMLPRTLISKFTPPPIGCLRPLYWEWNYSRSVHQRETSLCRLRA